MHTLNAVVRGSVVAALLLVACSQSAGDGRPVPTISGPPSPPATPAATATPTPTPGPPAEAVTLEVALEGLSQPIGIENARDGSDALYIVEQAGTVRRLSRAEPSSPRWVLDAEPFLDLTDRIRSGGEQGLLGLAFHPGYRDNRRLFVHYTDLAGDSVVAEYAATPDGTAADPGAERVLLHVEDPAPNHNGGMLAFGPDGYLYIALGDGGGGGDPFGHGQDPATLLGSILRIDVDVPADAEPPYGIPPDNPFVSGGGAPEVWSYGLRNPWRFSFDRSTGDLYIGDVGQAAWEEIDRHAAGDRGGENYGWNVMEGSHCFATPECSTEGLTLPLAEYARTDGNCSVVGGYVYRGARFPALVGTYLFGDYCSGMIWGLSVDRGETVPRLLFDAEQLISAFGEDESGEVYLVDLRTGTLYAIQAVT